MPTKESGKYFYIASIEKALRFLELLADKGEINVSSAAQQLGLNRANAHRYLATLKELGYVEQDEKSRYRLTYKLLELGLKFSDSLNVLSIARPLMLENLARFKETVNLGEWTGQNIIHIDKIESQEMLRLDLNVGSSAPAYCTGLGKAILAFLPLNELDLYLEKVELKAFTPLTITDKDSLITELKDIKQKGYSLDNEELASGLRCVAAPVFNHKGFPKYAISIAGPAARITDQATAEMADQIMQTCARLSQMLGMPRA
jgi:DNA-binding IclR family transcriptional regulator